MPRFFNRIRKQLAKENKFFQYSRYAIGEILLVVIGILIALQINNWNEAMKVKEKEFVMLRELKTSLEVNISNLEEDIEMQLKSAALIDTILQHADAKRPYNDSLPGYLQSANYAPDVVLSVAAFETLKSTGLDIIESDVLRREIVHLFEEDYPLLMQETKRIEDQLWPAVVMPLYQKHFRHDRGKWYPNDYVKWLEDPEFFNMLSFRGEMRRNSTHMKIRTRQRTLEVLKLVNDAMETRTP